MKFSENLLKLFYESLLKFTEVFWKLTEIFWKLTLIFWKQSYCKFTEIYCKLTVNFWKHGLKLYTAAAFHSTTWLTSGGHGKGNCVYNRYAGFREEGAEVQDFGRGLGFREVQDFVRGTRQGGRWQMQRQRQITNDVRVIRSVIRLFIVTYRLHGGQRRYRVRNCSTARQGLLVWNIYMHTESLSRSSQLLWWSSCRLFNIYISEQCQSIHVNCPRKCHRKCQRSRSLVIADAC